MEWLSKNLIGHRKPDLILWTGDSISHDLIGISEEDVLESIRKLTNLIKKWFPQTPLVLSLGNHDFEPANYQSFEKTNSRFLDELSIIWKDSFLGSEDSISKFREFGFFAVDAPDTIGKDLRIISINTQSCYVINAALTKELNDSGKQL